MIISQEARLDAIRLAADQGLPPVIEDPTVLGKLQALHRSADKVHVA